MATFSSKDFRYSRKTNKFTATFRDLAVRDVWGSVTGNRNPGISIVSHRTSEIVDYYMVKTPRNGGSYWELLPTDESAFLVPGCRGTKVIVYDI